MDALRRAFTPDAMSLLRAAEQAALSLNADSATAEHVALAILRDSEGLRASKLLDELGLERSTLGEALAQQLAAGSVKTSEQKQVAISPSLRVLVARGMVEALAHRDSAMSSEHLLLALLDHEHLPGCQAAEMLGRSRIGYGDVELYMASNGENASPLPSQIKNREKETSAGGLLSRINRPAAARRRAGAGGRMLAEFGVDLTERARKGELDPVIGREDEIERMISILCRRTKNNPALIGEPGVGKTALAEGLAQRIVAGKVPGKLANSRIISVAVGSLVSNTTLRGQFEDRVEALISELSEDPSTIAFIDELHLIIGAGAGGEGNMDAANLMKPALARGQLRLIGATTSSEYRKYIEADAALERRFAPVVVAEPTPAEAFLILEQLSAHYAKHHNVTYTTEALQAAVDLSVRHLPERRLPDKAIDLLDEAGSRAALRASDGEQPIVTDADMASLVERQTGVPVSPMGRHERAHLGKMEQRLNDVILGQTAAVSSLAAAIRASRRPLLSRRGPAASFIFTGPHGVGKTSLAHTLARELFGSSDAVLKLDMSEFSEAHTKSSLIGAPAGYIGHNEPGRLTEPLRRRPYQVVLLDDFELAHPEIRNLFLQILEGGTINDRSDRTISFRDAILIVVTSAVDCLGNSGRAIGFRSGDPDADQRTRCEQKLRELLGAPLVDRVDEIINFAPFDDDTRAQILDRQIAELAAALDGDGVSIEIDPALRSELLEAGRNEGARGLIKSAHRLLERPMVSALMANEAPAAGSMLRLSRNDKGKIAAVLTPPKVNDPSQASAETASAASEGD